MKKDESHPNCDPRPPHARPITLKDGRYMIFFEFREPDVNTADLSIQEEPPAASSAKDDDV